jgi:hypothetical protein
MRQQLDELDALLQRMLTLPVNQMSEPERNPLPEAQLPIPVPRPRPKLPVPLEQPLAQPKARNEEFASAPLQAKEEPATVSRTEPPSMLRGPISDFSAVSSVPELAIAEASPRKEKEPSTPTQTAAPARVVLETNPLPGWGPSFEDKHPPFAEREWAKPAEPSLLEKPSPFLERHAARLQERQRAAPWLAPLGWINAAFDRCALALGRPGLMLVRSEGRDLLGWIGVGLCVAAAVILVGDWFGWTW